MDVPAHRSVGVVCAHESELCLATETRELDALDALAARDPALLPAPLAALRAAAGDASQGREGAALDKLEHIGGPLEGWASELRRSVFVRWLPSASTAGVTTEPMGAVPVALPALIGSVRS